MTNQRKMWPIGPVLRLVFYKDHVTATLKTLPKAFSSDINDKDFKMLTDYIQSGKDIRISKEVLKEIKFQEKTEQEIKEIHKKIGVR